MKLFNAEAGIFIEHEKSFYRFEKDWDELFIHPHIYSELIEFCRLQKPVVIKPGKLRQSLLPPIQNQEVWASGVTYFRSKIERQKESEVAGGGSFYDRVYHADRPELFFKATPHRVVGHLQEVRIRMDSTWNVPEPELTLAINNQGRIFGYTIGNDMSSRSIEGENPLYLAQAKIYDGSAALGPCLMIQESPLDLEQKIFLRIKRNHQLLFKESIHLSQMKRTPEELVGYLIRACSFPKGCYLMTGTGIIPPEDFTLHRGDEIEIHIESIGTLSNLVR